MLKESSPFIKLHDIFLQKFLFLFITIFLTLGIIFYLWIKDIYIEQIKIDLLNNIDIVSLQIKNLQDVDSFAKRIKKTINLRVTIISKDGTVLGESDKDFTSMDNHLNRTEVIQAKYQVYGSIVRYSNTLKKELLYVSKKYKVNKEDYYIRMARDIEQINQQFLYLSLKIGFLFLLFMIIVFKISLSISKDVQDETKNILEFLRSLIKQTKPTKINSSYSIEFNKITKLLTSVSANLSKKDKQKSKYTAKLKLSNRQKDDIISAISHEFKNPIAVINGYTQTLLEEKDINPNIREKFLNKISSNSQKLTNMIDRLRLSIKLEEGKQPYSFKSCDIYTVTKEIIEDLKLTYPNREIILEGSSTILDVDETMLSIAISNLIENGLKYSQDNIIVKLNKKSLQVMDSGIGIKKSDISKITDKFYRVSSNGWNNSLGLGLSLVNNILDLHKFKLQIDSIENEGTTFKIIF
ncbi:MAG: HAMP domain-containing sensor histidine kinase [Campylobacterota bacterium]|nr:HAMP domain-containing sensor histidine kinase [Campylobacterota bacterium]